MRAAIYARVSTERQERQQTIDSQLSALRAWAGAGGHELNDRHVFRDEGYSGARLDRPGLDALRDAVRDGEVEVLGILAPDRLARNYAYQALLLEEFRRAGCAVAFLGRAISDDPGDQLLLQIQGAVAEYERALLSERFRRGKLQKARAGQYIGVHAPYGYRRLPRRDGVAGQLAVDETEAEVVRMLYGWLIEEQLTQRQILKRLNAGPWLPRCGRRPWAAGTVHHILSDPVYAGTAYANRYECVPASEPCGGREPGRGGKDRIRLRPQEQWIPIAVPALVDRATAERAAAQLARNAAFALRNNKKHDYLLRCLLTCGGCGLAMCGTTKLTPRGVRRYYRCGGKDCVRTGRAHPCPRAGADGEALERAVWGHIRDLLADPDRLIAQFQHFAADADRNASRDQGPERRLAARLDGLRRADARLLDAYQAEVISLEELTERRRQLDGQRCGLERQLEQQRDLRRQRAEAQELLLDLAAFCERVRGRLDDASFAEKQAILQLVVERVIVHEDNLEIRHVIPLRNPPPGREDPPRANGRLRSDRVHLVANPGCAALLGVVHVRVVGRGNHQQRRREALDRGAPAHQQPILPGSVRAALRADFGRHHAEVLHPHPPQQPDSRHLAQPRRRVWCRDGCKQRVAVTPDPLGAGPSRRLTERDVVVVSGLAVALRPGRVGLPAEPVRGDDSQGVQRRPHRLDSAAQAVEGADGPKHMRAVRALPPARHQQFLLAAQRQQRVEQQRLRATHDQAAAELTQHRRIEARIGQFQP